MDRDSYGRNSINCLFIRGVVRLSQIDTHSYSLEPSKWDIVALTPSSQPRDDLGRRNPAKWESSVEFTSPQLVRRDPRTVPAESHYPSLNNRAYSSNCIHLILTIYLSRPFLFLVPLKSGIHFNSGWMGREAKERGGKWRGRFDKLTNWIWW